VPKSNEACHFEFSINLPTTVLVEQVELRLQQEDSRFKIFEKYLKVVGVTSKTLSVDPMRVTDDVTMTHLNLSKEEKLRQRSMNFKSGYFDKGKKALELNYQGAVCHQVNILFEFDKQKATDLINECKELIAQRKGIAPQTTDRKAQLQISQTQS
jgi:hypothetical protein